MVLYICKVNKRKEAVDNMEHFGGSKTHECEDCGSRLIEDKQCLTCDSKNIKAISKLTKEQFRENINDMFYPGGC
jgi:hypothetical protein